MAVPIVRNAVNQCYDYSGRIYGVTLPYLGPCRPKTGAIFTECDTAYNCTRCQSDPRFFMPWVAGDQIYIQTNFTDRENTNNPPDPPSRGFGDFIIATLCTNTALNETDHTLFSDFYGVGYKDNTFYQQIVIDTNKAIFSGVTCFTIKFEIYSDLGEGLEFVDCIMTEPWELVDCEKTVLIESEYFEGIDCCAQHYGEFDNWLGTDKFRFRNITRFWATLVETGIQTTRRTLNSNNEIVTQKIAHNLNSIKAHAFYSLRWLNNILGGSNVEINGKVYTLGNYNSNSRKSYRISFTEECTPINC